MYNTVTQNTFIDAFKQSDTYKNNFSYEGLCALFDYIESYEDDTASPQEFDMVAIACEFNEYTDLEDYNEQYNTEYEDASDIEQVVCQWPGGSFICMEH